MVAVARKRDREFLMDVTARDAVPPGPEWLFAYGTLGPRTEADRAAGGWEPDAVRGRLFDLGPYPGLVDLNGPDTGWVEGHSRPVTRDELVHRLDPYEGVDRGLFARRPARTRGGRWVWVYTYEGVIPPGAPGPLSRWEWPEGPRPFPGFDRHDVD
jgi:gamma-glutamylcyclotransferase (GGCT)/AIG2-like uncharacterized protein YtfP